MAEPVRIPIVYNPSQRVAGSDKDSLAVNVYYDVNKNQQKFAVKRPGLVLWECVQERFYMYESRAGFSGKLKMKVIRGGSFWRKVFYFFKDITT